MIHEAIFLATCNATMTNKKPFKLQSGCHTFATFFATCNAYHNKRDGGRAKRASERWALIGPFWRKLRCKLLRGCYTQAACLATLRKVEGPSTFLATRNATIAVAKWVVTREFFLATCNATFVALQVERKIASCNMALKRAEKLYGKTHALWMFLETHVSSSFADVLLKLAHVTILLGRHPHPQR